VPTAVHSISRILIILALTVPMGASAVPAPEPAGRQAAGVSRAQAGPEVSASAAGTNASAETAPEPSEGRAIPDVALATSLAGPSVIPAPPVGGPRPTINATPLSGFAGQEVTLSGQGVAGYSGVRLAWVLEDATQTLDVVEVDETNSYSASVFIPTAAVTGTNEICAAVTGTTEAEFACTNFTVIPPPTSTVEGGMFVPEGEIVSGAEIKVFDDLGNVIASDEPDSDGSFSVPDVPPGVYTLAATGRVPKLVNKTEIKVAAGVDLVGEVLMELACSDAKVTRLKADPAAKPADNSADWGTYIALGSGGDAVNVSFEAEVQHTTAVERVEFEIERPDGSVVNLGSDSNRPYSKSYNVSLLPPGISTLRATPVPAGDIDPELCSTEEKTIKVVDNPLDSSFLFGSPISWNSGQEHYTFDGQIPSLGGALPLVWPDPPPQLPAPINAELRNKLNAGLLFEADVDLSGRVTFRMLQAKLLAEVFSQTVYQKKFGLRSAGINAVQVDPHNVRALAVDYGPFKVKEYHKQKTIFSSILFSAGVVDLRATIKVGVDGALYLEGTIQPLLPELETTLTANAQPKLIGKLAVDAKAARIEGRLIPSLLLSFPLMVRTTSQPYVRPETPCLIFKVDVNVRVKLRNPTPIGPNWAKVLDKTQNLADEHQPPGCSAPGTAHVLASAPPPSRILPSPDVATSPTGQVLAAYVKDATPEQADSTAVVAVRFRSSSSDSFGPETVLAGDDGDRDVINVADPVVAFVGDTGEAIAAWTETVVSPAEADGITGTPEELMAHQEIAYAHYDGTAWATPARLTDDTVPDGIPDIDGDVAGATLAWVHDTGGILSSTARIKVSEYDATAGTWSSPQELNAYPGSAQAMNYQVSVDRRDYPGDETYQVLAWTADEDGDLTTADDQYIARAIEGSPLGDPGWFTEVLDEADGMPGGAFSPSVALLDPQTNGYDRIDLAFLLRRGEVEVDGELVSLGAMTNQAQLWQARKFAGEGWLTDPVVDEVGNPVLGEAPQLYPAGANSEDTLLAFRRFGDAETIGLTGQMAMSKNGLPPLPYTNDLNQHWLPAFAVDFTTGDAMLVNVSESFGLSATERATLEQKLASASRAARPAAETSSFPVPGGGDLETIRILPDADPALDPDLVLSQRHASAGASVAVTATVRNLGPGVTGDLTLEFYDGTAMTGTLIYTRSLTSLIFNESVSVSTTVTAAGGAQPLTARLVVEGGTDSDGTNNEATADLGALPAPKTLDVQKSSQYEDALMLSWVAPAVPGVAGYRVFRSTSSGGPYDLIAATTTPFLTDRDLARGATYYYVVQAYDAAGVRSPLSGEAMETLPTLSYGYIPLVMRDPR